MADVHTPIRLVIADDHPLVRDGLRRLFELQPGFTVVGEAADGIEALQQVKDLKPDVLLLDLAMPRLNGLDVLREMAAFTDRVRTVLLTAAIEREEALEALRLGARGVVVKESATQLLYKCIRAVMKGEYWVGHERIDDLLRSMRETERVASRDPSPASRLTLRELGVVRQVVDGASNRDIAKNLGLSGQTVKNHLSNIFDKLGVSNRLELALYAVHHRLLAASAAAGAPAARRVPKRRQPPAKQLE
jgi:DNA-binding NarL/FixJ family response regulator